MMWDVARFNASARRLVLQWRHERKTDGERQMSIGEYLDKEGYSEEFKDNYLIVSLMVISILHITEQVILAADDSSHMEYAPRQMCDGFPCADTGALLSLPGSFKCVHPPTRSNS